MPFTDNQEKGITLRDRNILVSAAAGSGKTSVLVERIIRKITDKEKPIDIDRFLIMTFTSAAAKEMRDRIREAIDEKLDANPNDENLYRQSVLIHSAQITTIHGFCQSVLKDHFGKLSIDPNFRVGDENECKLLRIDVLENVLEKFYEEGSKEFLDTVEWFSGNKSDDKLSEIIMGLYLFSQSAPNPSKFLEEAVKSYDFENFEEYQNSTFVKNYMIDTIGEVNGYLDMAKRAELIIRENPEIAKLDANISAEFEKIEELSKCSDYDKFRDKVANVTFDRLASVPEKTLSDDGKRAKSEVASLRDAYKAGIGALIKTFSLPLKSTYENMIMCKQAVNELRVITEEFARCYQDKKAQKNIIDFNDMEHMAIKILSDNPDIADEYRKHFEEIYVDEYQDSNMSQEMLVNLICKKEPYGNLFMVGDVKQSIYRFRQARPDLFISKYESYTDEDSNDQRIILNDNFRSRREVLEAVNEVFKVIMTKDVGGIEYDAAASLKYGAKYYDEALRNDEIKQNASDIKADDTRYKAELLVGITGELSAVEMESSIIANRISKMIREKMPVYDTKIKALRPVQYKDIVILVRSLKAWDTALKNTFADANIPLAFSSKEGYFETLEVETVLAFLKVMDNPRQDIALMTVLKSPIGDFTDKEVAILKIGAKEGKKLLIEIIEEECQKDTCEKKCKAFLDKLSYYRKKSVYTPVYGIIREIVDSDYGDFARSMDKGEQRMANLNMLINKAADYGKTSFTGLFNFVRYIELIRKYEIEDGEAGVLGEADDVVRVMTIHKSKGLEFPVCFIAGMEKARNVMDERKSVVWDIKYGIGVDRVDINRRFKCETLYKSIIKNELRRENIAEELRVLYVAMTRAREKLIMVGVSKDEGIYDAKKSRVMACASYLDLIGLSDNELEDGLSSIDISYIDEKDLVLEATREEIEKETARDEVLSMLRQAIEEAPVLEDGSLGEEDLNSQKTLPAKLSVSELKKMAIDAKMEAGEELVPEGEELFKETEPETYVPDFMRGEGQTNKGGTFYGTAFHRILELWPYDKKAPTSDDITEFTSLMLSKNHMSSEQASAIRAEDIAFFLNSELGQRFYDAKLSGKLFREQPFVIGIKRSEDIFGDRAEKGNDELVLVQGIIDAFIEEDDGIAIIDYKTDYVTDAKMLINRYEAQLKYYKEALEQVTGKQVKELIIYSSRLKEAIGI